MGGIRQTANGMSTVTPHGFTVPTVDSTHAKSRKAGSRGAKSMRPTERPSTAEFLRREAQLTSLQNRLNGLVNQNNARRGRLAKLADELVDLSREGKEPLGRLPELTAQLAKLKVEDEESSARLAEERKRSKTYHQIYDRLMEQRIGRENDIDKRNRTLGLRYADCEDLLLMSQEANHTKERAKNRFNKFEKQTSEERVQREQSIDDTKQRIQQVTEMNEQLKKRGDDARQITTDVQMQLNLMEQEGEALMDSPELRAEEAKLKEYKLFFEQLKGVCGVKDVNGVVRAFQRQTDHTLELQQSIQENDRVMDRLRQQKQTIVAATQKLMVVDDDTGSSENADRQQPTEGMSEKEANKIRWELEQLRNSQKELYTICGYVMTSLDHVNLERLGAVQLQEPNIDISNEFVGGVWKPEVPDMIAAILQIEQKLQLASKSAQAARERLKQKGVSVELDLSIFREQLPSYNVRPNTVECDDGHGKRKTDDGGIGVDSDHEGGEGEEFDLDDDSDRPMDRKTAKLLSEHSVEKHLRKLKKKSK